MLFHEFILYPLSRQYEILTNQGKFLSKKYDCKEHTINLLYSYHDLMVELIFDLNVYTPAPIRSSTTEGNLKLQEFLVKSFLGDKFFPRQVRYPIKTTRSSYYLSSIELYKN